MISILPEFCDGDRFKFRKAHVSVINSYSRLGEK